MQAVHTPVLLSECLSLLSPAKEPFEKNAFLIDSTLGEGGHSQAFLETFPSLKVLGIDADASIQKRAKERLLKFEGRVEFRNSYFDDFFENYSEEKKPNLILFDLGISTFHYELSGRGFSFFADEVLDMRLSENGESAADIVNGYSEGRLADLIYFFGEEKCSRKIAAAICKERSFSKIKTASHLAKIVEAAVKKNYAAQKIHPATRTFQALRIAVNRELERLSRALFFAFNVLDFGGKMGVISFHSLEDRIAKNFFRNLEKKCVCPASVAKCVCEGKPCGKVLTKKPVFPSEAEVKKNPPSRSAKLRVVKKIQNAGELRIAKM